MGITSGKVVSGRIELEGEPLPDGALATVLSRENDESFELELSAEAELLESLAEAGRGEVIPAEEVFGNSEIAGDRLPLPVGFTRRGKSGMPSGNHSLRCGWC